MFNLLQGRRDVSVSKTKCARDNSKKHVCFPFGGASSNQSSAAWGYLRFHR